MSSFFSVSAQGTRAKNQDSLLLPNRQILAGAEFSVYSGRCDSAGIMVAAVADGIGGAGEGEIASLKAISVLQQYVPDIAGCESVAAAAAKFEELLELIDREVQSVMDKHGSDGGCTLSVVLFDERQFAVCNVGDSPVYLLNGKNSEQLSHDDTYAQELLDNGTPEEDIASQDYHCLTQAIGACGYDECHVTIGEWQESDVVVLASDGICNVIPENKLAQLAKKQMRFAKPKLYAKAGDNTSFIIICR